MKRVAALIFSSICIYAAPVHANTVEIIFNGTGASGDVAGLPFTNQAWMLTYLVNTSTSCTTCTSAGTNVFDNAILGGSINIGGASYSLTGVSATGLVALNSYQGSNIILINPASGGYLQFVSGAGTLFPALFSNPTSLASANIGASIQNSIADNYGNSDVLNFEANTNNFPIVTPGIYTTTKDIDIVASQVPGSAGYSWSVSVAAVPEPSTWAMMLLGFAGLGFAGYRRTASRLPGVDTA